MDEKKTMKPKGEINKPQLMNIFNGIFFFLVPWCWIVHCKLMVMANIWCCAFVSYVQAMNDQSFCLGVFYDL
jgi:hypothetical protein